MENYYAGELQNILTILPSEILSEIFNCLNSIAQQRARSVCKKFHNQISFKELKFDDLIDLELHNIEQYQSKWSGRMLQNLVFKGNLKCLNYVHKRQPKLFLQRGLGLITLAIQNKQISCIAFLSQRCRVFEARDVIDAFLTGSVDVIRLVTNIYGPDWIDDNNLIIRCPNVESLNFLEQYRVVNLQLTADYACGIETQTILPYLYEKKIFPTEMGLKIAILKSNKAVIEWLVEHGMLVKHEHVKFASDKNLEDMASFLARLTTW